MLCTEEEAKTKWCPFTRISSGEREWHTNRPSHAEVHDKAFDRCLGADCAAWRFESPESYDERCTAWEDAANIGGITDRGPCPTPFGWCGLAGKP